MRLKERGIFVKNHVTVGFNYTYKCPLKCNFCANPKSVIGDKEFTSEELTHLVIEFSKHQDVDRFVLTGGEPFLYIKDIIKALKTIRSFGVQQPFRMVTSGYWGNTNKYVEEIIDKLKLLGVDEICLSYDFEHAQYVSSDAIKTILHHAKRVGILTEISGTFWNETDNLESLISISDGTCKRNTLVMPTGRAKSHFQGKKRYNIAPEEKVSCGHPRSYSLSIYPDGEVYPCCAGGFSRDAKLGCGNVYIESPKSIISNVYSNFHVRIAKEIGFDKLYHIIQIKHPEIYDQLINFSDIDSVCQVCESIHSDSDLLKKLTDVYKDMEIDYIISDLENWWDKIEEFTLDQKLKEKPSNESIAQ